MKKIIDACVILGPQLPLGIPVEMFVNGALKERVYLKSQPEALTVWWASIKHVQAASKGPTAVLFEDDSYVAHVVGLES